MGAQKKDEPFFDSEVITNETDSLRKLPSVTSDILIGLLVCIYTLFFITELQDAHGVPFSAPVAARYAIQGFWNLCRVMCLNIVVLIGLELLSKKEQFGIKRYRFEGLLLNAYGIAFNVLDAYKLIRYMQYGLTERRIIAFWFLIMMLFVSIIFMIHYYKKINYVRICIFAFCIWFTILCALPINQITIDDSDHYLHVTNIQSI